MRYIIGIDLGTTNSCVAYVDTRASQKSIEQFKIPQLVSLGSVRPLPTLPSFCYIHNQFDFPEGSLKLPWIKKESKLKDFYFVGSYAKTHKDKVPNRLIHSAKSWLSHKGSNRQDKIIPIEAEDESIRISPVEASARYLKHIKEAWDHTIAKGNPELEFNAQDIIITVPASFDEVARYLTMNAAKMAGFSQVTFLEEPQAAFYSWIERNEKRSASVLKAGDKILVCDIGGGTTDFSLIDVTLSQKSNETELSFSRMAVGNHLLLGGDNMDAAIAAFIEEKLSTDGFELSLAQKLQLLYSARNAKELVFGEEKQEVAHIVLQGSGSSVVKGSIATTITRSEIENLLLGGFFKFEPFENALKLIKSSGLRSMGLPYENEPSVIKHLAHFLATSSDSEAIKPDYILFNGGATKPSIFQDAIIDVLKGWFPEVRIKKLESYDLDLAVSRGAAYFGKARKGFGIRIGGGLPRSYYIVVEKIDQEGKSKLKALTLVPRGAVVGEKFEPDLDLMLQPNTTVSFQLCSSHVRLHDNFGDMIEIDPETMHNLSPMLVALKYGKKAASKESSDKIPVHIVAYLTEIGTIEICLKSLKTEHTWQLEFQIKRAAGQDNSLENKDTNDAIQSTETFDVEYIKNAQNALSKVFIENEKLEPKVVSDVLENALNCKKQEWPPSVTRSLADCLLKHGEYRKKSISHHERWWNLLGFLMRPGFGYPADDFRIKELWKSILENQKDSFSQELKIQLWICYRRIAGGMSKGQQMQIAPSLMADVINKKNNKIEVKNRSDFYVYSEKIRTLGSFELIDQSIKIRLGKALVEKIISQEENSADYWALGRIGARHLLYGTLVNVIPKEVSEKWIFDLLKVSHKDEKSFAFLMEQLARKTVYSELNVSKECVDAVIQKFSGSPFKERLSDVLLNEKRLTKEEQEVAFGEHLPIGLSIYS